MRDQSGVLVADVAIDEPLRGPLRDGKEHGFKGLTLHGQAVFDLHRSVGDDGSFDYPFGFELLEPLRQKAVTETRNGRRDVVEPMVTRHHGADDRAGPTPSDDLHGLVEPGAVRLVLCKAAEARRFRIHRYPGYYS